MAVGVGLAVKTFAVVVAVVAVLSGVVRTAGAEKMTVLMWLAFGLALLTALFLFSLGALVSAQGRVLRAALDHAVNTSPFLSNEHRAKIMSL